MVYRPFPIVNRRLTFTGMILRNWPKILTRFIRVTGRHPNIITLGVARRYAVVGIELSFIKRGSRNLPDPGSNDLTFMF